MNKLIAKARVGSDNMYNIGNQTAQFIQMFFRRPKEIFGKLDERYLSSQDYVNDLGEIHFLRQESLAEDLVALLATEGFTSDEFNFIKNHRKVNKTRQRYVDRTSLWTEKALEYVEENESFLFRILKNKGIDYQRPTFL
ncbi:hypothetical protein [Pedobacter sp. SYSU D00535]|uniref:hypothetical protein n=1 Tax=Pedobacter sp. SYSU D00535 TaxID=2810308 RepID=UPI001A97CFF6|nr:hypothetical protein [Pedobacter sp. SYSU D00535]